MRTCRTSHFGGTLYVYYQYDLSLHTIIYPRTVDPNYIYELLSRPPKPLMSFVTLVVCIDPNAVPRIADYDILFRIMTSASMIYVFNWMDVRQRVLGITHYIEREAYRYGPIICYLLDNFDWPSETLAHIYNNNCRFPWETHPGRHPNTEAYARHPKVLSAMCSPH